MFVALGRGDDVGLDVDSDIVKVKVPEKIETVGEESAPDDMVAVLNLCDSLEISECGASKCYAQ